jgi:7-cyano-7-deazaguanine synthase in queuosine biosynthesis
MTSYVVRTDLRLPLPADSSVRVLDWAPASHASTIHVSANGGDFFGGWRPEPAALDLLVLAAAVYCVDKTALRSDAPDLWTRELAVEVPVRAPQRWRSSGVVEALRFLSGDRWSFHFDASEHDPLDGVPGVPDEPTPAADATTVSLFSGGLDSLIGVIDFLERHPDEALLLVSHTEGGQTSPAQDRLLAALRAHYGVDRLPWRRIFVRPAPEDARQARALPAAKENSTRSRSALFLSAAAALASSIGPNVPVLIPENGFIGINVPLTRARSGSYSTRTTHPHFLAQLGSAWRAVGVTNPICNPYRLMTKGEMLQQSANASLLETLAPQSVSCSHPEAARWVGKPQGNCGYCFPCLIRRASMASVGWDDSGHYSWDALTGVDLLDRDTDRNRDLRAVLNGAWENRPDRDVLRNGPIPNGEHAQFIRVWREGLAELRAWLAGASGLTAKAYGATS